MFSCICPPKDTKPTKKKLSSLFFCKKKTPPRDVPEKRLSVYERREKIYADNERDRQRFREEKLKETEAIQQAVEQLMEFERLSELNHSL
uniref:BZIP domain-containing protein n=1 Tax=Steinernema glaseri TaxID=37863 RepID=A0A1I8A5F0_9BILA